MFVVDYDPVGSMQGLVIGHQGYGPGNLSDVGAYPQAPHPGATHLPDLGQGMSPHYDGSDVSSTTGHQMHIGGALNPSDPSQMGAWFDSDV